MFYVSQLNAFTNEYRITKFYVILWKSYSPGQNIRRLFQVFEQLSFATSEKERNKFDIDN